MEAEAQPRSPYEWDENKRQETIRVRDVDFMLVDQADWSTALHHRQVRSGEVRYSSYTLIGNRLYNVVWTPRGAHTRIISLRKANGREITLYEENRS